MDLGKTRRVVEAKYKSQFFSSLAPGSQHSSSQHPEVGESKEVRAYKDSKYAADRHYYSTTYQIGYGRERYSQL